MVYALISLPSRFLLALAGLAVWPLPRALELRLGRALGRLILALRLFKVKVAVDNIALCFPKMSPEERAKLLEKNYEHYGVLGFEFMHFFTPIPGHYAKYARSISRLVNKHNWEKAQAKGKGVLFFSSHMGFWEMSAASAGLNGLNPTIVTTILKPAWLHDLITRRRSSTGVTAAWHPGSMPAVLRCLRKGGSVAFMNDQYARPPMGLPVEFFGVYVDTLSVIGPLAKRVGAAVIPVSALRGDDGIVSVTLEPEMALPDDPVEATQAIARHVEGWVKHEPSQWLFLHRRFKNQHPRPAARVEAA